MAVTWVLKFVRCGKESCWCGRSADGHGPYWYTAQHRGGRVRWKYVGRYRPESSFPQDAPPESYQTPVDPRFELHGKMRLDKALSILGFTVIPKRASLVARWRLLVAEHHPDRGGSTAVCAAINAANSFLRPYTS